MSQFIVRPIKGRIMSQFIVRYIKSLRLPTKFISAGHVTSVTNRKPVCGMFQLFMTMINMAHNSSLRLARQEVSALLLAHNSSLGLARQEVSALLCQLIIRHRLLRQKNLGNLQDWGVQIKNHCQLSSEACKVHPGSMGVWMEPKLVKSNLLFELKLGFPIESIYPVWFNSSIESTQILFTTCH